MSRTTSPTRNNLDSTNKLEAYRVLMDKGAEIPLELQNHISNVVLELHSQAPSPNFKQIHDRRPVAIRQNEKNGIRQIEPYLLFRGEAELDQRVTGMPLIYSKEEINLPRSYLPQAPDAQVKATWKDLSQPRPDTVIGYVTRGDAAGTVPPSQMAFSVDEELVLDGFSLTQYLHFPFLTSEWKTPNSNQNSSHAHCQAARDGAVIVNYLDLFYSTAYLRPATFLELCHFSLTCDFNHAELWVHWKVDEEHHMELVSEHSLRNEHGIIQLRQFLHNILEYAVGDRLQSIKAAIPSLSANKAIGRGPKIPKGPNTIASWETPASWN